MARKTKKENTESAYKNADLHFYDYFNAKQREYINLVLDDDLIEEYRISPLGKHSEPLERMLAYFRRLPPHKQYALKREANGTYRMISMSGVRGKPPSYVGKFEFLTVEEGYLGILLQQIEDMKEQ